MLWNSSCNLLIVNTKKESNSPADEEYALETFKDRLQERFKNDLIEIKIFGSKARGDFRADSDIDILITLKNSNWRRTDVVYEIASDILLETGIYISPKVFSEDMLKKNRDMNTTFIQNIIRDGVPI